MLENNSTPAHDSVSHNGLVLTNANSSRRTITRTEIVASGTPLCQQPSEGASFPVSGGSFTIKDGGAQVTARVTIDDSGSLIILDSDGSGVLSVGGGVDDWHKTTNPAHWHGASSAFLPAGTYTIVGQVDNIDMKESNCNNLAYFRFEVTAQYTVVIDDNDDDDDDDDKEEEPPVCNPCGCSGEDGDDTNPPSDETPGSSEEECGGSVGSSGSAPSSQPAALMLAEPSDATPVAVAPSTSMRYHSVWAWQARLQDGVLTIRPTSGRRMYFALHEGSSVAMPVSLTQHHAVRVELQNSDLTPCTSGSPAFWTLTEASGRRVRFETTNGTVAAVVAASGKVTTAEAHASQVQERFDAAGNMVSCYSPTQGLMLSTTDERGAAVLSWYAPANVTVDENGNYVTSGEPYKTSTHLTSVVNGVETTTVTRQQTGLPAHTVTRVVNGNTVTVTQGTGEDAIIRTWVTTYPEVGMTQRVETVRKGSADAPPASSTCLVRKLTEGGWLKLSETEGYGTEIARTTTYDYNPQFRVSRINRPDGGYTEYEYDADGRVTKETTPWGDGGKKRMRYVYNARSARFYDNRPVKVYTDYQDADSGWLNIKVVDYTYEDTPQVERTTSVTHIAGTSQVQTTIEESFGESPEYAYAAGKLRFSQSVNGVQTCHEYEATAEHNAVHKHTATTKANGELIAGRSRRREEFIAANDTIVWEQESIWDGESWQLLATAAHEYDEQQRLIKTTRGNGRVSTKSWMCCGLLSETDEDGIRTDYAYNSAHQQTEESRSAVYDGDTCITPETITEYTRDAMGRILITTRRTGAMETTESAAYDILGRITSRTDILGRVTTTSYSEDGLTTTVTTPAGATLITEHNLDGSVAHVSGTGQRELYYSYDHHNKRLRGTVKLKDNSTILSQVITDGFGQKLAQVTPSTTGYIYTRSEYNAKGQLTKQYQDTGSGSAPTAATLYEYDSFGNVTKQTLALSNTPTVSNSPIVETSYGVEVTDDGVFQVTTRTRYNTEGVALTSTQKQLISGLSATLENKWESINERNLTSSQWTTYNNNTKRTTYSAEPTSNITAETVVADGFTLSQKDTAGITSTATRRFTVNGMVLVETDGRGNATTTVTDEAGRTISVTDAADHVTTTAYDAAWDKPSIITDAQGNTTCYRYDERGRKVAEWGTGIQPALFGYDEADKLVSLKTFRAGTEIISTDPAERTDADETTWVYDPATGLELSKTYADGSSIAKTYDAFNRLAIETDARGNVKTHSYEVSRALLLGTSFSNGDTARRYTYNHLGQLTQVVDEAGVRIIGYNAYGEQETDSLLAGDVTHLITETRDELGRSSGFIYSKDGIVQHTETMRYGADGRITSAGFIYGGAEKQFIYSYLPGSNLLLTLTMPCDMTLNQSYETNRNLLTSMVYKRGNTEVAERRYSHDSSGRPLSRSTSRNGSTDNDSFGYNKRGELTLANVSGVNYGCVYDNMCNRSSFTENEKITTYTTNKLNQYTTEGDFVPIFDEDGNQTKINTSSGIWRVVYNTENRPVSFTSEDNSTVIECSYDSYGRRATKKVTVNGSIILHQRYIYRGYLQVACCDLTRSGHPCLWLLIWDPAQPIATRPLAIRKDGTWFTYGWDITKNICEVFSSTGYISTAYSYSPYGEVTSRGDVTQPIQWSSEFNDSELRMSYYNYRHYNPADGRWIGRDRSESDCCNLYAYTRNHFTYALDVFGRASCEIWTGMANESAPCLNGSNSSSSPSSEATSCSSWNCEGSVRRYNASTRCCEYRSTTQKKDYTPSSDGCGSGWNEPLVPDLSFSSACILHDICYGTCGTDRTTCDNQFRNNLYTICEQMEQEWRSKKRYDFIGDLVHGSGLYLATCKRIADVYYLAVNQLGEDPFEKAQDKACEWHKCTKN